MRMKDKVCLVTGSCKGIGLSIVERLLEEGAVCVLNSRSEAHVRAAVERLHGMGYARADGIVCDVTDKPAVNGMMDEIVRRYGRIDVLVNNAAVNKVAVSYELEPDDFRHVLDVNLVGPMICCQAAGLRMRKTGGGAIVNIASVFSQVYTYRRVPYSCSKTALLAMTKVLAVEWADDNIRVTAVAPGWLKTDMNQPGNALAGYTDRDIVARTPMHRYGSLRDIANAVLYLASDESAYVTGTCLNVDGGWISYGGWCDPVDPMPGEKS